MYHDMYLICSSQRDSSAIRVMALPQSLVFWPAQVFADEVVKPLVVLDEELP